jgi:hypothetical protein
MAATSPALIVQTVATESLQNRRAQLTDTRRKKSKKSSFRIAGFVINHPILAMLVLGLIALIGVGCIFALPIGWLPF